MALSAKSPGAMVGLATAGHGAGWQGARLEGPVGPGHIGDHSNESCCFCGFHKAARGFSGEAVTI